MTVARRTLDRLAAGAAQVDRVLAAERALASLLGAPLATVVGAPPAERIERVLDEALTRMEEPAAEPAGALAPARRPTVVTARRPVVTAEHSVVSPVRRHPVVSPVRRHPAARRPGPTAAEDVATLAVAHARVAPPMRAAPAAPRRSIVVVTGPTRAALPAAANAVEADAGLVELAARVPGGVAASNTRLRPVRGEPVDAVGAAAPSSAPNARPRPVRDEPGAHGRADVVAMTPPSPSPTGAPPRTPVPPRAAHRPVATASAAGATRPPIAAPSSTPRPPIPARAPAETGIVLRAAPRPEAGAGLAHLAAWWREHEATASPASPPLPPAAAITPSSRPPDPAPDPPAGELDGFDAFSRALERVLLTEARRHGVPLEEP